MQRSEIHQLRFGTLLLFGRQQLGDSFCRGLRGSGLRDGQPGHDFEFQLLDWWLQAVRRVPRPN